MEILLIVAVALLSFANGSNDNFKGVATLWGAGRTTYGKALAWATGFTFLGSLLAAGLATTLAAKFNGSALVAKDIYTQMPFLAAVALGAAGAVLLASRLGLPISTTHALTGALVGAGALAAGFAGVRFVALGSGVVAPLLFSPLVSLGLTLGLYPLVVRVTELAGEKDCVCVDEASVVAIPAGASAAAAVAAPAVRWTTSENCDTGAEVARLNPSDTLHWFSAAGISFARGLNDTPKIAALLLLTGAGGMQGNYLLVALAMAMGGALGATRVAQTMSRKITPMADREAVTANLVAASLVLAASAVALPVSTTHVTSGSILAIGWLRRQEADWRCVRDILLSWVATLPLGAVLAACSYWLLMR